jgi:hypothetical protein
VAVLSLGAALANFLALDMQIPAQTKISIDEINQRLIPVFPLRLI